MRFQVYTDPFSINNKSDCVTTTRFQPHMYPTGTLGILVWGTWGLLYCSTSIAQNPAVVPGIVPLSSVARQWHCNLIAKVALKMKCLHQDMCITQSSAYLYPQTKFQSIFMLDGDVELQWNFVYTNNMWIAMKILIHLSTLSVDVSSVFFSRG